MSRLTTNNRRFLSVGLLLMGLMIALGALGVGFGLWSKVLTIEGTVHTGVVNAELTIEEVDQGAPPFFDDGQNEDHELEGKDVADCIVTLEDGLSNPGNQTLHVEITNAYPSFWCIVNFDIDNIGTIPIKLDQPTIITAPAGVFFTFGFTTNPGSTCYFNEVNGVGDPNSIEVHPQLEPGERTFCTLWLHVEQEAEQGAWIDFKATICAHQWNEEANSTCDAAQ